MVNDTECILVTGGAGFIGSHLVDSLLEDGSRVVVLDNMRTGSRSNLSKWLKDRRLRIIEGDILNRRDVELAVRKCSTIFHLAADPEVRLGAEKPSVHYRQNIQGTFNLLEVARRRFVRRVVFASTSAVYGDVKSIPVSESYGPLKPISVYGASKLACEGLITSYSHSFNMEFIVYRLANIVGPGSRHGIIFDFVKKLRRNPRRLEILGDGKQIRSYLAVDDCIEAMVAGLQRSEMWGEIFNVASEDYVDVTAVADIVVEKMVLSGVEYVYISNVSGGRGWIGDVKKIHLSAQKLKSYGWRPNSNSRQSVGFAAEAIIDEA